jgi:hypothetical protein
MTRLLRPLQLRDGKVEHHPIDVCRCDSYRGPVGGVCGACGGAIPTENERKRLRPRDDERQA